MINIARYLLFLLIISLWLEYKNDFNYLPGYYNIYYTPHLYSQQGKTVTDD